MEITEVFTSKRRLPYFGSQLSLYSSQMNIDFHVGGDKQPIVVNKWDE